MIFTSKLKEMSKSIKASKVQVRPKDEEVRIGRATLGLGEAENPSSRFERLKIGNDPLEESSFFKDEDPAPLPRTQVFRDFSKSILSTNDSPDIGFEFSINPYRGCEHGCIYCYARPTHEYLGLSAGMDFETKIFAKTDAARLLREKLNSSNWVPKPIFISGITDCYQPLERKLRITRSIVEVLTEFRNPLAFITKNHLVTRDVDLLKSMSEINAVRGFISITSLDPKLIERMEPRTSRPALRLKAIETLAKAGIPMGVMVAPVIPGLTDSEIPQILESARNAGAEWAGYTPVRLPYGVGTLFEAWLSQHFPDRKEKILNRIREIRGGKINDPNFNTRMRGTGLYAEHLRSLFKLYTKKLGMNQISIELSTEHFQRPGEGKQFSLFQD